MLPNESSPQASDPPVLNTQDGQVPALDQLAAFVSALTKKRDAAVNGRKSSGIEADWLEDEEFYQGIDDANRQFVRSWVATVKRGIPAQQLPETSKSTIFINITRPYVDAAAARLADMLLPLDDRCWEIKPTPIAELDPSQTRIFESQGIDPAKLADMQAQIQKEAERAADAMGDEIDDHLIECQWHGEVRAVIEDAGRIGSGVLKGPVPMQRTYKKWVSTPPQGASAMELAWFHARRIIGKIMGRGAQATLQVVTEIKPGSVHIDPWNFFPDPACGENIHNGQYTWERAYITPKQLRDMETMPGFAPSAIAEVLTEGPKQLTSREASDGTYIPLLGQYEMWTFYGTIAQQDATASGLKLDDETPLVNAIAVLVNDKLIKLTINALDTGEYPYDVLAWQRRPGVPWGMGVGRHIRTPQRMLNAAGRAMMDNSGMTAGPQIVIGVGITPADGNYDVRGRKVWRAGSDVTDVTKAFYCYIPDSHQPEFEAIIRLAQEIAEQTTGMPLLLQGQAPTKGSDTLGGMQLLQNNASGVLRRLAKRFDDFLTEPHIRRYYDWLMQYSRREDIKGDFQIDARGSSSLVERDANKQFMFAAMNFAKDPEYGIDPYKLFTELAKSDRIDPAKIQLDEDDYKARVVNKGPSELDQAKAALATAQAANQKAQETLANVQALFSAVTTANAVALNPALAPAADATAKSAGFVDADAPPAVAVPAGATASPPGAATAEPAAAALAAGVPGNTHPGFPPSADRGVGHGLEGGRT